MGKMFANVPLAAPDPIFHLAASHKADPSPLKVNLGIGAYRTGMFFTCCFASLSFSLEYRQATTLLSVLTHDSVR